MEWREIGEYDRHGSDPSEHRSRYAQTFRAAVINKNNFSFSYIRNPFRHPFRPFLVVAWQASPLVPPQ